MDKEKGLYFLLYIYVFDTHLIQKKMIRNRIKIRKDDISARTAFHERSQWRHNDIFFF